MLSKSPTMAEEKKSFIKSVTGFVTSITALIIAIGGLITALNGLGFWGIGRESQSNKTEQGEPKVIVKEKQGSLPVDEPPSVAVIDKEVVEEPEVKTTSIYISYAGDMYYCQLPIQITLGEKVIYPQGNMFQADNIPLGYLKYQISGQIICNIGTCIANGKGTINVEEGSKFKVLWVTNPDGTCNVNLLEY
jgi:hypothetical protein